MLTLKKIAMLTAPALMIGGAVLLSSSVAEAQTFEVHIAELRHACSLGDGYACQEWRWAIRQPRHLYMAPTPHVYRRYHRRYYRPHRVHWQPRPRRMVHRRHVTPRHHRRHHAAPAPRHHRRHHTAPAPRHHRRGPAVHRAPRHRPAVHHAPRRGGGGNHARRGSRGGNGGRGRRGHI